MRKLFDFVEDKISLKTVTEVQLDSAEGYNTFSSDQSDDSTMSDYCIAQWTKKLIEEHFLQFLVWSNNWIITFTVFHLPSVNFTLL